jgi:hypothetical protein
VDQRLDTVRRSRAVTAGSAAVEARVVLQIPDRVPVAAVDILEELVVRSRAQRMVAAVLVRTLSTLTRLWAVALVMDTSELQNCDL